MSKKYMAIYKCRLCGKVYENGARTGQENAELCMVELNAEIIGTVPTAPRKTETHHCGGAFEGSFGLADFQGWLMEEYESEK